jgi:aspartyl-tRNA(Asn)/glutamyl-tRNA(Gln) amidotransferase subunit A
VTATLEAATIPGAAGALRSGRTTSRELAEASLAAAAALDGELSAFVALDPDGALEAADAADAAIAAGRDLGPLMGVPVAIKDIVDVAGLPTRCGSPAYPATPAATDATLVRRLRHSGAVIVGKTTTHELACGVYSPPVSNPWDLDRIPGGSSGGSGAAVAAGIVPMAIGSDTGGSIRIPASLCGTVGLKATYGRVSRAGVAALAWSLDHLGPLTSTVAGSAAALEVLAGPDPLDPSASSRPVPQYSRSLDRGVDGLRIGVLSGAPLEPIQPDVAETFAASADLLGAQGAAMVGVEVPELEHGLAAEFGIVAPEAGAYHRELVRSRPDQIDPGIRTLLVAGLMLEPEHYFKALQARRVIADALRMAFVHNRLDALLTPTLPATAAPKDADDFWFGDSAEPVTLAYVRTTGPFNLSGLPALSVPAGLDREGLPIGLQIAAPPFDEETALRVGASFESAAAVSGRRPPTHAAGSAADD